MTCAHRPEVRKCSHSQDHSSPWSETLWEPLSPRNRISNSWKVIRWGSSAYRLAFSILEMRLEYIHRPPPLRRSGWRRTRAILGPVDIARFPEETCRG